MNAAKKKMLPKSTSAAKKPVARKAAKVKTSARTVGKTVVPVVQVTTRPVVVSVTRPAQQPRREEPQWIKNFKEFAAKNPATTVVGILAVTLAFILLLGR